MLLFTAIFVFCKLTILQGNYAEEISGRLNMTFSCKQNRNSKRCLFAILLILIWGLKKRTQQNKGTLILEVEVPAAHQQMHFYVLIIGFFRSAQSKKRYTTADVQGYYGFNQWSVVRFVIKKLYVYLFIVKQYLFMCTYLWYNLQLYSCTSWTYIFTFYDLGINLQILSYF